MCAERDEAGDSAVMNDEVPQGAGDATLESKAVMPYNDLR